MIMTSATPQGYYHRRSRFRRPFFTLSSGELQNVLREGWRPVLGVRADEALEPALDNNHGQPALRHQNAGGQAELLRLHGMLLEDMTQRDPVPDPVPGQGQLAADGHQAREDVVDVLSFLRGHHHYCRRAHGSAFQAVSATMSPSTCLGASSALQSPP